MFLQYSRSQSELFLFGSSVLTSTKTNKMKPQQHKKKTGVILNSNLCSENQITKVVLLCFFPHKLRCEMIISAFLSSSPHDCNWVHAWLNPGATSRLQLSRDLATRLLKDSTQRDFISPIPVSLRCLLVQGWLKNVISHAQSPHDHGHS